MFTEKVSKNVNTFLIKKLLATAKQLIRMNFISSLKNQAFFLHRVNIKMKI